MDRSNDEGFDEEARGTIEDDVERVRRELPEEINRFQLDPLLTNPFGLCIFLSYAMFFSIFAYILQTGMSELVYLKIDYQNKPGCAVIDNPNGEIPLRSMLTKDYECFEMGTRSTGGGNEAHNRPDTKLSGSGDDDHHVVIEKFVVTVEEEMEGPFYLYFEIDGMYQNHFRYVKSTESSEAQAMALFGSYDGDHKYQYGTGRYSDGSKWIEKDRDDEAIYTFWHPNSLIHHDIQGGGSEGCKPRWATNDTYCLQNENDCEMGPSIVDWPHGEKTTQSVVKGHRTLYPCGLGFATVQTDTFMIIDGASVTAAAAAATEPQPYDVDQRPRTISYATDWKHRYRNLNPLRKFQSSRGALIGADNENDVRSSLEGRYYYEVLSMWMIKKFPPVLCSDDPLKIVRPDALSGYPETADCIDYDLYDPRVTAKITNPTDKKGPYCKYSNKDSFKNPLNNKKIECKEQYMNPAGWNLENSVAMNWVRLAADTKFWKLVGKIDREETWKVGQKKVVYLANRYDASQWNGKKAFVISSAANWSGMKTNWVPHIFLFTAGMALLISSMVLLKYGIHNFHLDKIRYLAWKDY